MLKKYPAPNFIGKLAGNMNSENLSFPPPIGKGSEVDLFHNFQNMTSDLVLGRQKTISYQISAE